MQKTKSQNQGERKTLSSFLVNYRDTPHFATGVADCDTPHFATVVAWHASFCNSCGVTRLILRQVWRDTPHFATVVAPAHMVFRDGYRSNLPHKSLSEKEINLARLREKNKKINRKNVYNSSCLTKNTYFEIGNFVLVKNYKRHSKFDPYFLPKKFSVIDISANGNILFKTTPQRY